MALKSSCTVLGIIFSTCAKIINIMHIQCNHDFKMCLEGLQCSRVNRWKGTHLLVREDVT
jgi:hypothetical protein